MHGQQRTDLVKGVARGTDGAWSRARSLAGRQHGVVSRDQLLGVGAGKGAIDHALKTGALAPLHRGVYRLGPLTGDQAPEMAAVLACAPRSCVSHQSAAHLHKLPPYPAKPHPVHVSVIGRDPGSKPGITIHRIGYLTRGDVTQVHGIPVTAPARTILDLAATLDNSALEHLLAEAYAKRLTTRAKLLSLLARYPRRPGTRLLRELLDAASRPARTRSNPERRLLSLIRSARLPEPRVNVRLHGWEVDFLWPTERLVVEVDALSTHTRRQLADEPHTVVARIAAALALADGG